MSGEKIIRALDAIPDAQLQSAMGVYERKKKLKYIWVRAVACMTVLLVLGGTMLGMEMAQPDETRPQNVPSAQIDWNMYAVWVDQEGNVQRGEEPFMFSLQCAIYDRGGTSATELDYVFTFPENFRYEIKIPSNGPAPANGPKMTGYPYYVSFGYVYDFQIVDYTFAYWAMSLEKEWMIFEWEYYDGSEKDPGAYLIAFRDPNANPQEILTYFQGFLDSYSPSGPHIAPPALYDGWNGADAENKE